MRKRALPIALSVHTLDQDRQKCLDAGRAVGLIPKRGRWVACVTLLLLRSPGVSPHGNYGAFSASGEPAWSGPEGQDSHSRGRKAPVSFATMPQAPEGRKHGLSGCVSRAARLTQMWRGCAADPELRGTTRRRFLNVTRIFRRRVRAGTVRNRGVAAKRLLASAQPCGRSG